MTSQFAVRAEDGAPSTCPEGHPLEPGRVQVGWKPCVCKPAWAENGGHTTWTCRECEDSGVQMICYRPPHVRDAADVEQGLQWLRAAVNRYVGLDSAEAERYRRALYEGERLVEALRARPAGDR